MLETIREIDSATVESLGASGALEWAAGGLTAVGAPLSSMAIASSLVIGGKEKAGKRALLSVASASMLTFLVKELVARPRPSVATGAGFSFPSGHSAASLALATSVFLSDEPESRLFLGIAAVVPLTRVLLGEHYPSDVAAGSVLGAATAIAVSKTEVTERLSAFAG